MRLVRVAGALIIVATYLGLPSKNYYWDGIWLAQTIEDASRWPQVFHPNHLVYSILGYGLYHMLGTRFRALYVLQGTDAVFGAATVCVLFGVVRRLTRSEGTSLLLSAAFAFSGTWWRFVTDADPYIHSVFFITLSALLLLPGRQPRALWAALSHFAAMLFHQLAVFFFPCAMVALWSQSHREDRRRRLLRLVAYTATALPLTLGAYFAGFTARAPVGNGFWSWLTSHSPNSKFSFELLRDTIISSRSWVQLFLIGRVTFVDFKNPGRVALLVLAAGAVAASVAGLARRGFPRRVAVRDQAVLRWALVWVGTYALFLLVWLPGNTFYKLFALPGLILLAGSWEVPAGTVGPYSRPFMWLAVALAAWNLACGMIPYSHIESNKAATFAVKLRDDLPSGAVIYYSEFNRDDSLVCYFNPQTRWVGLTAPAAIDADLSRGESVWVETTAADGFAREAPAWFAARTAGVRWHELLDSGHRIRFAPLHLP